MDLPYLKKIWVFLSSLMVTLIIGCSAEKNNVVSKTFHNTTARYNSYWIAKEKMKEIENYVLENTENNFNKILNIYPRIDSTISQGVSTQIEECIKKASIAIQRHQNSKWVDNSYILVGKSRFYNLEFTDAIETFKYVNSTSDDKDARHEALVNLMRTFIDYNEFNNAIAVSDYLKKEKLNKTNLEQLFLTRAYLYQRRDDFNNMVKNLVLAAPLLTKTKGQARTYFIIGQVYQELGFDAEAYNNYGLCLKNNPDYELYFYARLYRAQVFELSRNSDIKKVRKYFKRLLKDAKNKEFKDKIYYEMAQFEMKQENLGNAIEYYNLSVRASTTNRRQKAYSYWRLGEIYYEQKLEYSLAKTYYDSVLIEMPKDDESYVQIETRQKVLADFVEQLTTIQLQDSLLSLAAMDTSSLYAYLDYYIEQQNLAREEQEKKEKEREKEKRRSASRSPFDNQQNPFAQGGFSRSSSGWYFYNTSAVSLGQTGFLRKWGNRELEDHWRRSNKGSIAEFTDLKVNNKDTGTESELTGNSLEATAVSGLKRESLVSTIPFSKEEQQVALKMVEDAHYRLGNIYNFELNEKENAVKTFETLLNRFPETPYQPEVLYLLYLIYKDFGNDKYLTYKDRLISLFPRSVYAKIIKNPHYREESQAASAKLKTLYKEAYYYYKRDKYDTAKYIIQLGLNQFPENEFSDNLKLLMVLIIGKTENIYQYQYALNKFNEDYPDSELKEYLKLLIVTSEEFQLAQLQNRSKKFIKDFHQIHSMVIIYQNDQKLNKELNPTITEYINERFEGNNLNSANLILNDNSSMILIDKFDDKQKAMQFFNLLDREDSPLNQFESAKFHKFVITKDNFQIMYQLKDYESYLGFFAKHYTN